MSHGSVGFSSDFCGNPTSGFLLRCQVCFHPCITILLLFLAVSISTDALSVSDFRSAVHHFTASPPKTPVQELSNVNIPRRDGGTVLAYKTVSGGNNNNDKVVILLHEFFGLTPSICDKADAIARDVGCTVICPDTFRGDSSTFIPKCIWLALSTPQDRVNDDLDDVVKYMNPKLLAVMGFCYGGGKALRYACQRQPDAATVVCYGSPVTDVSELAKLKKPLLGVFGTLDVQFPPPLLESFQDALTQANVKHDVQVYNGVGHAFWKDMDQIERNEQPQSDAYRLITDFLTKNL